MPEVFAGIGFDQYTPATDAQKKALAAVRYLVAHRTDGFDPETELELEDTFLNVVLAGKTGVGKSTLAAAAVQAVIQYDVHLHNERLDAIKASVEDETAAEKGLLDQYGNPRWPKLPALPMWLNLPDAITEMRWEFGLDVEDRKQTLRVRTAASHEGLVVLDDLGREKVSDWTSEQVYTLVNRRYENLLPTIVTCNATPEELAESSYWPAISRLAQYGALVWVDGPDHRLEAR